MKKHLLISAVLLLVVASFSGCAKPDNSCNGLFGTASPCIPQDKLGKGPTGKSKLVDSHDNKTVSGYSVIGQSLLQYPGLDAVEDDFGVSMFNKNARRTSPLDLPIYEISVDQEALANIQLRLAQTNFLKALDKDKGDVLDGEDNDAISVYSMGDVKVKINKQTGRVVYFNLDAEKHPKDVDALDKRFLLTQADDLFHQYIPSDVLQNTYFYRYVEYVDSSALSGGEVTSKPYAAAVALNSVVNHMPVIGSGGKYSVHIGSDGTLSRFDFQFSRFKETPNKVSISDSAAALQELNNKLAADGISLKDHEIKLSKLGYYYLSNKGVVKWLVPCFSFEVVPKEGVNDMGRIYTFPASKDAIAQQLFDEDFQSEALRKSNQIDPASVTPTLKTN